MRRGLGDEKGAEADFGPLLVPGPAGSGIFPLGRGASWTQQCSPRSIFLTLILQDEQLPAEASGPHRALSASGQHFLPQGGVFSRSLVLSVDALVGQGGSMF